MSIRRNARKLIVAPMAIAAGVGLSASGCSDVDAHVPKERVDESADVFSRMGASVEKRIYPGMGHLITEDEIAFARSIIETVND